MADDRSNDIPVHSFTVKAKESGWPGDDLGEFGYYPEEKEISKPVELHSEDLPPAPPPIAKPGPGSPWTR